MTDEVRRMNRKLAMCPRRRRRLLREEALAAWRFQPSHMVKQQDAYAPWIFEASQRDMEIVTRALVRVLNSTPDKGVISGTSNQNNEGACASESVSSSSSSCDPGSPSEDAVEAKTMATVDVSDSMAGQYQAPGTRTTPAEVLSRSRKTQRSIPAMNNIISKKRLRRRIKAPITITRADPTDFQAMVQQVAGSPVENNSRAAPFLLKPQPKRPN